MPTPEPRPRIRPRRRHSTQPRPWGPGSWQLILYALWFTGLTPLLVMLRAFRPKPRRAVLGWWALAICAVLTVQLALLALPMRWQGVAFIQAAWSLAVGLACAAAVQAARHRGWLERDRAPTAPVVPWRATWRSATGCALLMYGVVLTDVTVISMIGKALDQSTRQPLSPIVLWWALPGMLVGAVLGGLWHRRLGAVTGKVLTNFLIGSHLVAVGVKLVLWLLSLGYRVIEPPSPVQLYHADQAVTSIGLLFLLLPVLWYGYYTSLAGRIRSVFGRAMVCYALFLISFVQVAISTGDHGLWYRYWALRHERAEAPALARQAVRDWERYLTIFPDTDERAEALWRTATTFARLNRSEDARAAFQQLASLPPTAPGQLWVRQAALILRHPPVPGGGARHIAAGVPITEAADYLDEGWRSLLSFVRAAQPEVPTADFLVTLRRLSLAADQLTLPALTNLFEAQAYGGMLGSPVTVEPLSLDEIKAQLDRGKPVLVPYQDQWWCLIGYDARWGTLLFYDYGRETDRLRVSHQRAEAKAILHDTDAASQQRLGQLRRALIEDVAEDLVAQALRDHHGLCAILGTTPHHTPAPSAAWETFLLGELAYEADDPVLALESYAESVSSLPETAAVLPYLHVARLMLDTPPREIMERRLPLNELAESFARWRQQAGHEAVLERARLATERTPLEQLPSAVLERLAETKEVNDPADRPLLIRLYTLLHQRYPESTDYLTALAEACRKQERWDMVAAASQQLALLQPEEDAHRFRLAEAQLQLNQPREAQVTLREFPTRAKGQAATRYLALAGRIARALGQHQQAVQLLRRALERNLADPDLRCELALAYEGLGRRRQALAEWRWVELADVDPSHLALARQRLAGAEER